MCQPACVISLFSHKNVLAILILLKFYILLNEFNFGAVSSEIILLSDSHAL